MPQKTLLILEAISRGKGKYFYLFIKLFYGTENNKNHRKIKAFLKQKRKHFVQHQQHLSKRHRNLEVL